jgi:hypothetical protein
MLRKEASLSSFQFFAFILISFRSRTCGHSWLRVSFSNAFLHSSDRFSWAGFVLSRQLDKKKFQPVVVSPRTYFVFTPLLASTAVGTLEFRTTLESVRARSAGVSLIFPLIFAASQAPTKNRTLERCLRSSVAPQLPKLHEKAHAKLRYRSSSFRDGQMM